MARSIFINYRRQDSEADAGRLFSTLKGELPDANVFLDSSVLTPGSQWPAEIEGSLRAATTVLVLIGADWLRAGSDAFGRRPIDADGDWVRREVELAIEERKQIIPVFVHQAKMPPSEVLPISMRKLTSQMGVEIRGNYWDHDVKLLVQQLQTSAPAEGDDELRFDPYPAPPVIETAVAITDDILTPALSGPLRAWRVTSSPLPEDPRQTRVELFREYKFSSFADAIGFMAMVAKGCDVLNHHPRWENIWRTLRVYLTTWNVGHKISDRDVQLAKYFDAAYGDFSGRVR